MIYSKCYRCDEGLTESNKSDEHIIPNFLGGRLKAPVILCKSCNSILGEDVEPTLIDYGHAQCHKYNIKRQYGETPNVILIDEITGKKVIYGKDGIVKDIDPIVKYESNGSFSISAHSVTRADQELQRITKVFEEDGKLVSTEFMKKEPLFNDKKERPLELTVHIHTSKYHKTILRMFVAFYLNRSGNLKYISDVIKYIITYDSTIENTFNLPYVLNACKEHHKGKLYHILIIKGIKKNNAIFGYSELFGHMGNLSILSKCYDGEDFTFEYTFDLVNNMEINYHYPFNPDLRFITKEIELMNIHFK
jgi:hypothetical protein